MDYEIRRIPQDCERERLDKDPANGNKSCYLQEREPKFSRSVPQRERTRKRIRGKTKKKNGPKVLSIKIIINRTMVTIEAIIERAIDGSYSVYCKNEIFSGTGESIEEAKKDMMNQMVFYKETAIKEGFKYPAFLDGDYEISYSVDSISLLKYYVEAGIFSLSGLEKITGINQKQLWSYLHGTKPRKAQAERIESGFRSLSMDLSRILA